MPGWLRWILLATALLLFGTRFVLQSYKIPAGSMSPTLLVGDHIYAYALAPPPARGDVIVFRYPKEPDRDFVKRVVAVPGDTIEGRDDVLYLNGQPVARTAVAGPCQYDDFEEEASRWVTIRCRAFEEQLGGHRYRVVFNADGERHSFPAQTVPADSYFVLGDNRDNSHDSRYWGFVPKDLVRATAKRISLSWGPHGLRGDRFFRRIDP